jgi:hypothetical protein
MMAELEKSACIELMIVQYLRATDCRRPPFKKPPEGIVRNNYLKSMSIDELWKLHEEVTVEFVQRLWSEELDLEERLRNLQVWDNVSGPSGRRRFDAWYTKRWAIRKMATQIRRRERHERGVTSLLPASPANFRWSCQAMLAAVAEAWLYCRTTPLKTWPLTALKTPVCIQSARAAAHLGEPPFRFEQMAA